MDAFENVIKKRMQGYLDTIDVEELIDKNLPYLSNLQEANEFDSQQAEDIVLDELTTVDPEYLHGVMSDSEEDRGPS